MVETKKMIFFSFEIWLEVDDGTTLGVCNGDGCCSEGVLSFSADFGCLSHDVGLVVGQELTSRHVTREGGKWVYVPWDHVFGDEHVDVWSGERNVWFEWLCSALLCARGHSSCVLVDNFSLTSIH